MDSITLTVSRYGIKKSFTYNTIEAAASSALQDIEYNQAFPNSICKGKKIIWENDIASENSHAVLEELAHTKEE